jgi:hypothetical protein
VWIWQASKRNLSSSTPSETLSGSIKTAAKKCCLELDLLINLCCWSRRILRPAGGFPSRDKPKSFVLCLGAGSFFVDCGSTASYVDNITGITWMPDDQFIDRNSGVNAKVSSASLYYPDSSQLATLRYFPDSRAKNCYSFPVTPNVMYQIRGTFFYGLYDHRSTVPSFWDNSRWNNSRLH